MSRAFRGRILASVCLVAATCATAFAVETADGRGDLETPARVVQVKQKTAKKKKGVRKPAEKTETDPAGTTPAAASNELLKFSRDIAPIIVANCAGCHNGTQKRTKLNLTSFEKMMEGAASGMVIIGGKPEESHLVLRIQGEETPKMPQGGNRNLSEVAITKIESWVKAGAILDAGIDPKAPMAKYAASPEDLRKAELAKLPAQQRDKLVETSGLERWKKASKLKPEVASNTHFVLFSTLSKERSTAALKVLDTQYTQVRSLLGPKSVEWGEKASLFVFPNAATYVEFVRAMENRDIEAGDVGSAKMTIPQPYVAVVDPTGGRDEPSTASPGTAPKKGARGKKGLDDEGSTERSLASVLGEQFVIGAAGRAGNCPRWLSLGLGSFLISRAEPRAFNAVRAEARRLFDRGWTSKAQDALGDEGKIEEVRAVGFAILEYLYAADRRVIPAFVQGMLEGGKNLDDVLGKVLNMSRAEFLRMSRYASIEDLEP